MKNQTLQTQAVTTARALAHAGTALLNVRGVLCAVPRGQVKLEFVNDLEQARDEFLAALANRPSASAAEIEDAFDALQSAIIRNHEHELELIRKFRVTRIVQGVAFFANENGGTQ
jgi:hypothetical protein